MLTVTFPSRACLRRVSAACLSSALSALFVLHAPACPAQEKPQAPRPLPATLSLAAKDLPLAQSLRRLAEQAKFNFVMAEAPEPGDGADVQLKEAAFASGLEQLCKPFDYAWKKGAGNVLQFSCQYTNLFAMPPLTMGEVWGYVEDLEQLAQPYRSAEGDGVTAFSKQLTRSLTLEQWKLLKARAPARTGLRFAELSEVQQRLLINYVTSQEFDFFVVNTQKQPWLQVLQHEDRTLMTLYEPGSISRTRPEARFTSYIFIASYTLTEKGREYGELCIPPFTQAEHEAGSAYRQEHCRPIEVVMPQTIAHEPPLPGKRIHLYALNAPLSAVVASIAEQTGEQVKIDKNIGSVRVSLWLDDVAFADAFKALAALHDWRFLQQATGPARLLRHLTQAPPRFVEVPARILQALPLAVRRYMKLDVAPKDLTPEQAQDPFLHSGYNWKVKEAVRETQQRVQAWDFAPFRQNKQTLAWKDLKRWQQNDFLGRNLYDLLNYAGVLHTGFPPYVLYPEAAVLRISDPKSTDVSLEIYAHGPDGKYGAQGAGSEDDLDPATRALLVQEGIFPRN